MKTIGKLNSTRLAFGPFFGAAIGLLLLSSANAWASDKVSVNYVKPETFSDMPFASYDRDEVLKTLTEHFAKLGAKLPADQTLKIEVTDIDLAGRIEPLYRGTQDIRILRGRADWPSMQLRYTIESKGTVLQSGEERLADMSYLDGYNHYVKNESLRYEKKMIDSWFNKKILAPIN